MLNENEDSPFVLDYEFRLERGKPNPNVYNETRAIFTAIFSTKRLLRNACNSNILQADGTYKLMWQGYPLLVFGTNDKAKAFHIIAVAIASNENTSAYEFCFNAIKNCVLKIFHRDITFNILMSDAALAIKKAFSAVFPDSIQTVCWFHVRKSIQQKIKSTASTASYQESILCDIDKLHLCQNGDVFAVASTMFVAKWNEKLPEFIKYFKKQWLSDSHQNWFLGATSHSPSTNNGLESTNRRIKDDFDMRDRSMLSVFKEKLLFMLNAISGEYRDNKKCMQLEVNTSNAMWLKGREWSLSEKRVKEIKDPANKLTHYYVPAGENNNLADTDFAMFRNSNYNNFDVFVEKNFAIWKVSIPYDVTNFRQSKCTCPSFLKDYNCKHIIGIGLRMQLIELPTDIEQVERKRKRGRAKKPGPALSKE